MDAEAGRGGMARRLVSLSSKAQTPGVPGRESTEGGRSPTMSLRDVSFSGASLSNVILDAEGFSGSGGGGSSVVWLECIFCSSWPRAVARTAVSVGSASSSASRKGME